MWVGGLALLPAWSIFAAASFDYREEWFMKPMARPLFWESIIAAAIAATLVACLLRGGAKWQPFIAPAWLLLFALLCRHTQFTVIRYPWAALASIAMVASGVSEGRKERVNLGVAGFGLTVLIFYFSSVMDKFGRSFSLITLGILFLLGGWLLERMRRKLVDLAKGANA